MLSDFFLGIVHKIGIDMLDNQRLIEAPSQKKVERKEPLTNNPFSLQA